MGKFEAGGNSMGETAYDWNNKDLMDHGAAAYNRDGFGAHSKEYVDKDLSDHGATGWIDPTPNLTGHVKEYVDKDLSDHGAVPYLNEEQKTQMRIERAGTTSKEMETLLNNSIHSTFLDPEFRSGMVERMREEPQVAMKVIEQRVRRTRGDLSVQTFNPEKIASDIAFINEALDQGIDLREGAYDTEPLVHAGREETGIREVIFTLYESIHDKYDEKIPSADKEGEDSTVTEELLKVQRKLDVLDNFDKEQTQAE